jgi:hypothetical protein
LALDVAVPSVPAATFPPETVPIAVILFTIGLSVNPGVLLEEVALFRMLYAGWLASVSANVPLLVMVDGVTANMLGTVIPTLVTVPVLAAQPVALPFGRMPVGEYPEAQRVGVEANAVVVAALPVVLAAMVDGRSAETIARGVIAPEDPLGEARNRLDVSLAPVIVMIPLFVTGLPMTVNQFGTEIPTLVTVPLPCVPT